MSENNDGAKANGHSTSSDSPREEAAREQEIGASGFPSSPGSDETPQETTTEESSSAPKPEKETDKSSEKGEEPAGSPYEGGDDGE